VFGQRVIRRYGIFCRSVYMMALLLVIAIRRQRIRELVDRSWGDQKEREIVESNQ